MGGGGRRTCPQGSPEEIESVILSMFSEGAVWGVGGRRRGQGTQGLDREGRSKGLVFT